MNRSRIWPVIRRVWITTGLVFTAVFVTWSLIAYRANGQARAALGSDGRVAVKHAGTYWSFDPPAAARTGLIFFAGALVDPVAYAPLARAIAEEGFTVLLVELPRRGAFGGAEGPEVFARARAASSARPGVTRWVVAGHSRGGVVAAQVVRDGFPGLAGAVLIGTSHPRDFSIASTVIPMTRVFGTRDTVADVEKLEATRSNLPATVSSRSTAATTRSSATTAFSRVTGRRRSRATRSRRSRAAPCSMRWKPRREGERDRVAVTETLTAEAPSLAEDAQRAFDIVSLRVLSVLCDSVVNV